MAQHTDAFVANYIQPKVRSHMLGVALNWKPEEITADAFIQESKAVVAGHTHEPVKKCGVNDLQDDRKSVCRESRVEGFQASVPRWGWTLARPLTNQVTLDEILTSLISVNSSVKWTARRNK